MAKKTVTETIRVEVNEILSALNKVGLNLPKKVKIFFHNSSDDITEVDGGCYFEFTAKKEERVEYILEKPASERVVRQLEEILDIIPGAVRVREGGAYEDLIASLSVTLVKLGVIKNEKASDQSSE